MRIVSRELPEILDGKTTMARINIVIWAALMSAITVTSAFAQAGFSEPAAFQAMNPNRDVLNGGALTPAGRLELEQRGGASNAYAAGIANLQPSVRRHHSYAPASRHLALPSR